jgi:hypothetical protein
MATSGVGIMGPVTGIAWKGPADSPPPNNFLLNFFFFINPVNVSQTGHLGGASDAGWQC